MLLRSSDRERGRRGAYRPCSADRVSGAPETGSSPFFGLELLSSLEPSACRVTRKASNSTMALQHLPSPASVNWQYDRRSAWQLSVGMATLGIITLVGLFWQSVTSAIKLWWTIPTYNYAFLILPISAYLIWRKRAEVGTETPVGSFWGIAVTAAFALLWLISDITDINEGRHIAFIGMVLGILLACLGWRIFKILVISLPIPVAVGSHRHRSPSPASEDCNPHLLLDAAMVWHPCLR